VDILDNFWLGSHSAKAKSPEWYSGFHYKKMRWLLTKLFRWYFNIKPLEQVRYYKLKSKERAKLIHNEEGALEMKIDGEKYNFPGFPRGHVLMGSLASLKKTMKEVVFNELAKIIPDTIPVEQMCPFVKEVYRVMTMMEQAEVTPDMKSEIRNAKKIVCFFLQEDDAYRFRAQWALGNLNVNKCKLSKADKYYFRAKWFKCDYSNPDSFIGKIKNDVLT